MQIKKLHKTKPKKRMTNYEISFWCITFCFNMLFYLCSFIFVKKKSQNYYQYYYCCRDWHHNFFLLYDEVLQDDHFQTIVVNIYANGNVKKSNGNHE